MSSPPLTVTARQKKRQSSEKATPSPTKAILRSPLQVASIALDQSSRYRAIAFREQKVAKSPLLVPIGDESNASAPVALPRTKQR